MNALLTGDTLVLFQGPALMAAAEPPRLYSGLARRSSHQAVTFCEPLLLPATFQLIFQHVHLFIYFICLSDPLLLLCL